MCIVKLFLCLCLFSSIIAAQQKYLISPNQEVIPIGKGDNTSKIINDWHTARTAAAANCDISFLGPDPTRTPATSRFGFTHKTLLGQWYVAPATGFIDTVYWMNNGSINGNPGFDSTILFRVFRSNISQTQGPGVRPGPYPPPCRSWGYWNSTADLDQHVAAFREDATDTTWISTIETDGITTTPSFPPFAEGIWGLSGVPIKLKPFQVNKLPMTILPGGLAVTVGDVFFIALKINSPNEHSPVALDVRTEFAAGEQNTPYPSRNWKFYEHDSGPSNCTTMPTSQVKKGWVARGGFRDDSLSTAMYNLWFIMTPTANSPPSISSITPIANTLSTAPQSATAEIFDCDKADSNHAGVATAVMYYSVSPYPNAPFGGEWNLAMTNAGGDQWEALIPGQAPGATVRYRIVAFDSLGLGDSTGWLSYKIINLNSSAYRCDTTLACTSASIHSATAIDSSKWFLPHTAVNRFRGDDGTAGPFSLGGPFVYYGDTMNYAWVGVNGAIALSKSATDTIDLNANGFWSPVWDFPQRQHHSRADVDGQNRMPKNFIAPLWADWIVYQDSPAASFGKIRYSNAGGKFVVEWDSVGDFDAATALPDNDVFRVVMNRSTGVIEFQYEDVGVGGLDTANLVGIQCDSLTHPVAAGLFPPFNYFNKNGAPVQTRLRNGLCIHYIPVVFTTPAIAGWNMISIGTIPPSYEASYLFPNAFLPTQAYGWNGGFHSTTVLKNGPGYWIRLRTSQSLDGTGSPISTVSDTLYNGWTMIGSISTPVPISAFTTTPPGLVSPGSIFYSYKTGAYASYSTIDPGCGYWVHSSGAGHWTITKPAANTPKETPVDDLAGLSRIAIKDGSQREQVLYIGSTDIAPASLANKYVMPPPAPEGGFDARFATQWMVEIYPSGKARDRLSFPLQIQTSQGSGTMVKVSWWIAPGNLPLVLTSQDGKMVGVMSGEGSVSVDLATTQPVIKVAAEISIPKAYALSRNYPNPFNPVTHFTVEIPRVSNVEVAVYDLLGRKIATLMSGEQSAGYHLMEWNGKDSQGMTVPSGLYFVRMNVRDDEFSAIQKVMFLK